MDPALARLAAQDRLDLATLMAEAFLSTIWYRVAELRPRLRAHVTVHRHRYRGRAWYVLHDHGAGKVHRFTPGAYMLIGQMDGSISVDAAWKAIAETHDADAPSQDDVIRLLALLHQNDLIQYEGSPDIAELLERYNKNARQLIKQNLTNPVSIRVPLWDPDAFLTRTLPFVRFLLGWFGLALWLGVVLVGALTAAVHWQVLTSDFTDRIFAMENILVSLVTYPLLKALHELAHGYLAKVRGAEVREMGIMFLVFFPVPYVDASAAAAFPNKWHRAAVSAGGIAVETFVAALAIIVWTRAETGMVTALAFNLATIGGLSTLLVNGNPLLKFDGYYILCDLLEIPNLGNRANKYLGHVIQRHVFRARQLRERSATWGEKVWFVLYAPAAFIYRLVIMFGIALFVAQKYFIVGVLIAFWSMFNALIKPTFKSLRHVVTSPGLRKVRRRAYGWTFGGAAIVIAALLMVPLPLYTDTEGIVWLPDSAHVRAGAPGFVAEVAAGAGEPVTQGAPLIAMTDLAVDSRIEALEWRVEEQRRRLAAALVEDRARAQIIASQLDEDSAELAREEARRARLTVLAAGQGRFEPIPGTSRLTGQYFAEGDLLGYVVPDRPDRIRIVVPQADIGLVRDRLQGAEVKVSGRYHEAHDTRLIEEVPAGQSQLPSPALSAAAGGRFLTDPGDTDGLRTTDPVFIFDLAVPDSLTHAPFGARVLVRLYHGTEPAARQLFRRVRQLFLRQFNA